MVAPRLLSSSGQDAAFSAPKPGFDSRWEHIAFLNFSTAQHYDISNNVIMLCDDRVRRVS